jgi:hypothetical protein
VQEAFAYMIWIVVGVSGVLAAIAFFGSGSLYDQIGRGGLSINDDDGPREPLSLGASGGAAAAAEQEAEIRQLLEGRNARRLRRGEPALDVDAELARLMAPVAVSVDAALEAEIRDLVAARNARRARRGQEPLDVEAEVARQISELG